MINLINRDALIQEVQNSMRDNPHKKGEIRVNHNIEHRHFIDMIYKQTISYDIDKVIDRIRKIPHGQVLNVELENEIVEILKSGFV